MTGQFEDGAAGDARLRAALRAALPEPPLDEVDWVGLRRRIALDAAPALARLARGGRPRGAWWEYAARWAVPALPTAFAAAAALVLVLGRMMATGITPETTGVTGETASVATRIGLEAALGASGGSGASTEARVMFASADEDALLQLAVTGR